MQVLVGAAVAASASIAYCKLAYPKLVTGTKRQKIGNGVGACRWRFPGSCAAQIYYPTNATADDCLGAYSYFRPGALEGMATAVKRPKWVFTSFGLDSAKTPCLTATRANGMAPHPAATGLPVILFSPGLFGHCDVHAAIGHMLAKEGYCVIVLEHEGGAASFSRTESGEVLTYKHPPEYMPDKMYKDGDDHATIKAAKRKMYRLFLNFVRGFREPILNKRISEIERVVACLCSKNVLPLVGETGLPFEEDDDRYEEALSNSKAILKCLNTDTLIMAGHSFGGATAILAAQSKRPSLQNAFSKVLLFDPWTEPLKEDALDKGIMLPTFALLSSDWPTNAMFPLTAKLLLKNSPSCVMATLPGTFHQWVADTVCWAPWWLTRAMKQTGELEPGKALELTVEASVAFLEEGKNEQSLLPLEQFQMLRLHKRTTSKL